MKDLKSFFQILSFALLFTITACQHKEANNELRVGTIAGPETQLVETAKQIALRRYGLNIEIVQFSDYTMPNAALADGSIDANMFQHLPYLQAEIQAKGYQLTPIAKTFVYPMAIYSKKIKHLSDLKNNAVVVIPNDPSNEARALLLLQKAGLIELKPNTTITATVADVTKNPKNLTIKEVDAAQLPLILPDADIAVINTNYATLAGLIPSKDGLLIEGPDSLYANLVVVRTKDKTDPRFLKLVAALHSAEVLHEAQKLFHGQVISSWK